MSELLNEYLQRYQGRPDYPRQRSLLGRFERWLEEHDKDFLEFDYKDVEAYLKSCTDLKRSTKMQFLRGVHRFLAWSIAFKTKPHDESAQRQRLDRIKFIRLPKEERLLRRDELTIEELENLLKIVRGVNLEDFDVFAVLAYFGFRRGELKKIRQINFKENSIHVIGSKTMQERVLFFSDEFAPILRDAASRNYLNIPGHKLQKHIKYYNGLFDDIRLHAHIFRRTFNTHMRNSLKDDGLLRILMGHSEQSMTDRYDAALAQEIREAMTVKHYMRDMIPKITT